MGRAKVSSESAVYEQRAYYSLFPPQRYWNRKRCEITLSMAEPAGRALDAGCGSGMILLSLGNAVGIDVMLNKLRYMKKRGCTLVNAAIPKLPFCGESFDSVICSEVIEHIPYSDEIFSEFSRVLKPGGKLILGTPDYGTLLWRIIEPLYGFFIPHGYKDEHITRYTRKSLTEILLKHGFVVEKARYILKSDLMLQCRKKS